MLRLYCVALNLVTHTQTGMTTKQTLSYRQAESGDTALGTVTRATMEAYPGWSLQSYVIMEIPPEHVALVFKDQEGQWTPEPPQPPVLTDVIKENPDEPEPAPASV